MSTMINTYHSSFSLPPVPPSVPPPVPPRMGHRGGSLMSTNTPLVKFLSVMMLLLMLLTFGGFLYLFHKLNTLPDRHNDRTFTEKMSKAEGRVSSPETESSTIPMAQLFLRDMSNPETEDNTLLWNEARSVLKAITLSRSGTLIIRFPGYYFIHSQVTFSKPHPKAFLKQSVWTRKTQSEGQNEHVVEKNLLMSYCSLPRTSDPGVPDMCTASQTGVFKLEKNEQLYVNVTDRKLVNAASTNFELFLLRE